MGKIDGTVPAAKLPKKAINQTFNHYLKYMLFTYEVPEIKMYLGMCV
jgi:hypothetical protein